MTLAAAALWAYVVGWPWWLAYREQARFERVAGQFKAGVSTGEIWGMLDAKTGLVSAYMSAADRTQIGILRFELTNGVYFVCLKYPSDYSGPMMGAASTQVEVYRLPPAPADDPRRPIEPGKSAMDAYTGAFVDFYAFPLGNGQDARGLECELIHSDPPVEQ
jgi:hypothetical protein